MKKICKYLMSRFRKKNSRTRNNFINGDYFLGDAFENSIVAKFLNDIPDDLKEDREVCIAAVEDYRKQDGSLLNNMPDDLKEDRDMPPYERCMLKVKKDGLALGDIPKFLIDYDLCIAAVKQNLKAIEYVPEAFLEDIKRS